MMETRDLILQSGSPDDWQDLYRSLWSRPEAFRCLFSKPSPDEAAAQKRTAAYAQMHRDVKTEFFVYEKASRQAIGIAGIKELHPGCWTVTDIALGPEYQGRGYGKQIVLALLDLAFCQYGAAQVSYACFAQNTASQRLALACGFTFSHSENAEHTKNGENVVLYHYKITKESSHRA